MYNNTKCGIYKITNIVNGKFYIGSSVELRKRLAQHKSDLRGNVHHSPRLQNSFNKYGEENFTFEVIETLDCDSRKLREVEQRYLDELKPYDRNVGFNINRFANGGGLFGEENPMVGNGHLITGTKNGFYGKRHSEQTKEILRMKNGGFSSPWFGRKHKEETKEKIRKALTGRSFSNEHRKNLSEAIKRAHKEGKLKPKPISEYTRQRQREAESISVVMLDRKGNYLRKFPSIKSASEYIGVGSENISRVCKGKNKTSGGYKWMYLEEYESTKALN